MKSATILSTLHDSLFHVHWSCTILRWIREPIWRVYFYDNREHI